MGNSGGAGKFGERAGRFLPHFGEPTPGCIVPDQDPLLKVVTRRIAHAELSRDFELTTQVLGTGYSGAVRLAQNRATKQQVAVKSFTKKKLKAHRLKFLQSEVEVYLSLDHPNICRLLHAYEGRNEVWLVMELCGSELYSRLCQRKVYRESDAADVMRQMLQAVSYLHNHRIVHRDLKLENWMYGAADIDDRLKLIDFGFSRRLESEAEVLDMPCGTLHYTSPEVLTRKYTSQCDLWSLGVVCYMLLLGRPPFRGPNNIKIAKAILDGEFPRDGRWDSLSRGAQEFLEGLLTKDPSRRFDAQRALAHSWLAEAAAAAAASASTPATSSCAGSPRALAASASAPGASGKGDLGPEVLRSLRKFAQGSNLQRAALTVMAYGLTSREIQEFEQAFLALDTSGRGTITLEQLAEVMSHYPEVSAQEVQRIFESMDSSKDEEIHYTPFIAAMLATRVRLHEDKVRAAFEAFDYDGTGYITASTLTRIFERIPDAGDLTMEEAEEWIREVDYKGNGAIDYEEFMAALMGKHVWAVQPLDGYEDCPVVRVFQDHLWDESGERQLCRSSSFDGATASASSSSTATIGGGGGVGQGSFMKRSASASNGGGVSAFVVGNGARRGARTDEDMTYRMRQRVAELLDGEEEERRRPQSFHPGAESNAVRVQVRNVACNIDERYFAFTGSGT